MNILFTHVMVTDIDCVLMCVEKLESANQQRCAVEARNHDLIVTQQEMQDAHSQLQEQLNSEKTVCAELQQRLLDAEAQHSTERAALLAEKEQLSASLNDRNAAVTDLARKRLAQTDEFNGKLSELNTKLAAASDEIIAVNAQNSDLAAQLASSMQQLESAAQQAQVCVAIVFIV